MTPGILKANEKKLAGKRFTTGFANCKVGEVWKVLYQDWLPGRRHG